MFFRKTKYRYYTCFLYRAALMAFIWWVLTDGDTGSLPAGLPFAAAAAVIWCYLSKPVPFRTGALLLFFVLFVWHSLQAGFDVALRVMRLSLPIDPAIISIPLRLPEGPSRVFLMDTMNLMPGTLTVQVSGDFMEVHVLDEKGPALKKTRLLENRVAAVFGHVIT